MMKTGGVVSVHGVDVCVSVCLCFQGWKILQNNFKALSVSLFTSPENVVLGSREEI